MINTNRIQNETFDEYALRMIENRRDYGLEYNEVYELLTGEIYANDNSRKALYGVKGYLGYKAKQAGEEVGKEIARLSEKESIETKADGSMILEKYVLAMEEDLKSPDRILEICGYDPQLWQLTSSKISKWNVSSGQAADGTPNPNRLLYSIRANVKPIAKEYDPQWAVDAFEGIQQLPPVSKIENNKEKVVFISLADLHYGLHNSDYEEKTKKMFDNIVIDHKDADIIIAPIGNDLLHYNIMNGTTPTTVKGTGLEAAMEYDEMFKSGLRSMCHLLDRLASETSAEIRTMYIPSNHDKHSTFGLYQALIQRYWNNPNITFDDSMNKRKYIGIGKIGLMIAHGDSERKRIFELFPVEAPEIFANSKCREGMLYHLHSETVKDHMATTYRRLPTVNEADGWHKDLGFIGSTKRMQVFTYDAKKGELKTIQQYYL